jgi:VEFS-Box of polycomb protein
VQSQPRPPQCEHPFNTPLPRCPAAFFASVRHAQYYHSRTNLPMRMDEMDVDSDDDVDNTWLLQENARLIDEYEDVSVSDSVPASRTSVCGTVDVDENA